MDRLEQLVRDALGSRGDGGGQAADPDPADVKAETRRAVAEVQRREAARQRRAAEQGKLEGRIKAVEDKVKERAPREYSRITRFMRWRNEDEDN